MPYKDKEKARAAKRKWDQEKRDVRGENWAIVAYPESMPENWLDILDDIHVEIYVSPLHDKDVDGDGELKKPHHHILFCWESKKSFAQMKEIADRLNAPIPKKQDSKRGAARYLCHLDSPHKAQYDPADVIALGGGEYETVISLSRDKFEVLHELLPWIRENKEVHRYSFMRVLDWCEQNNEKWFRALSTNCGWIVKEYLQSGKWDEREYGADDDRKTVLYEGEAAKLAISPAIVRDENGARVFVCHECGTIGGCDDFAMYGGPDYPNLGVCNECARGCEDVRS